MPHLSRMQHSARLQIRQLATTGLLPGPLGERLLSALRLAIPADIVKLHGVDPTSLLFNRVLAISVGGEAENQYWLRHLYLQRDFSAALSCPNQMRQRLTAMVFHDRMDSSWGVPPALWVGLTPQGYYQAYHETDTPPGGVLLAHFASGGQWVASLTLIRFEARTPFQPSDVAFVRLMAPLIGRLLGAALERERAAQQTTGSGPQVAGVLVLRSLSDWTPLLCTPAADAWRRVLREGESLKCGQLPTPIVVAMARMRAGVSLPEAPPAVQVQTPMGLLRVEASLGGALGGELEAEEEPVAIALVPVRPVERPDLPSSWPLTAQERRVLELLVQGLSNRQMAQALVVSEHTVEAHLAHAYQKLELNSRTQVLARLFQESYLPTLDRQELD